jgi:hypothetical protein
LLNTVFGSLSSGVAASTNSYESISTVTVGGGGAANVEFTSIPSTYKHLQVRCFAQTNRGTYGGDAAKIQFNSDTSANYTYHSLRGNGSSASSSNEVNLAYGYSVDTGTGVSSTFGAAVIDILDYLDTNKNKTIRTLTGNDINGTIAGYGGTVTFISVLWKNTSAITSIKFTPESGSQFNQYSSFALYGIKGA